MAFWDLFVVALMPVLKVLIITGIGLVLALERINLLGQNARRYLNELVFYVFGPALVCSYLAETVTLESLEELWFMPVNILLTFIIGSFLAWMVNIIARTPQHLRGLVMGCCAAGNLGNLLLIIIPAICDESDSPFGDSTTCTTNGDTYTSLSMSIGAIYIWSYVYVIIRISANKAPSTLGENGSRIKSPEQTSETHAESTTEPFLQSITLEESSAPVDSSIVESEGKETFLQRIRKTAKMLTCGINLKMLLTPITIGAIIGFIIGIVSPIRDILIGDDAPLRFIESSILLLGEALVPSQTLIVGANLLRGLQRSEVNIVVIIGVILVKYIAMPIIGVGVVKAAAHFGLVGSDPLFQFVLMLQFALPPAMSVGTITQLFGAGEGECSVVMLWTYAVAALSLTLWSTFFMWLVA
ncbi:protein PIN-LIKES 3 [Eucalyptus grandis]|uniref:protein PIN-LIKES 3 n=1 Tax=Eucalyptus grandis TaxID=71139 RepID=UPI00192E98E9|nr:protein PIN-LIKES 3 [Eucalyptus grandis]XP_039157409.1 protein PIN-LIKES 3 [Eucalyptus grandis]XP_039157410.1 protein PIN-LIKES 3 [Eucalyptus grandis]